VLKNQRTNQALPWLKTKCLGEQAVKGKASEKKQAQVKNNDFTDWTLAIDAF
jgi:hypothetical protein